MEEAKENKFDFVSQMSAVESMMAAFESVTGLNEGQYHYVVEVENGRLNIKIFVKDKRQAWCF